MSEINNEEVIDIKVYIMMTERSDQLYVKLECYFPNGHLLTKVNGPYKSHEDAQKFGMQWLNKVVDELQRETGLKPYWTKREGELVQ